MALSRTEKDELIQQYQVALAQAPHAFLVGFQGITVPQVTDLREKVRESGGSYLVVKNTLALRAIDGKALGALAEQFAGPTAVAFTSGDAVALAKTLTQFAKDVPAIQFKGGLVEGRPIAGHQVKEIASLPSREELVARLVFLLQSPIVRLVRTLSAVSRDFVVVLDQIRKKKEGTA
jgi:large subunit ribosomal protein L10